MTLNAQYLIYTISNVDNNIVVSAKANDGGGDITSSIFQFEVFLRMSTADNNNVITLSDPILNGTGIASISGVDETSVYAGEDAFGGETGFSNHRYNILTGNNATTTTFSDGVEVEVFRVELLGDPANTVNVDLVANTDFNPHYINVTGSLGNLVDPDFDGGLATANVFYGITSSENPGSGGTTLVTTVESVALPIKIKSFTAVPFENRDANLDWVTASEVNGSHFDVERSDDGVNFAQIGRVEATGNSSTDQDYKFSDREVNMERNDVVQYYRIKMVDIDGEYKYTGVRVVNFTRVDIDFTINAFPNPTVNYIQLELNGLDNTSTERPMLNVFSNTGELIRAEVLNSDLGKIDMSNLPSSLYHFIIDYKGQRYTEKIILIK